MMEYRLSIAHTLDDDFRLDDVFLFRLMMFFYLGYEKSHTNID